MARPGFPILGEVLLAQGLCSKMASIVSYKGMPHLRAFGTRANTNPRMVMAPRPHPRRPWA